MRWRLSLIEIVMNHEELEGIEEEINNPASSS